MGYHELTKTEVLYWVRGNGFIWVATYLSPTENGTNKARPWNFINPIAKIFKFSFKGNGNLVFRAYNVQFYFLEYTLFWWSFASILFTWRKRTKYQGRKIIEEKSKGRPLLSKRSMQENKPESDPPSEQEGAGASVLLWQSTSSGCRVKFIQSCPKTLS